ncbi:MAG: hypothetical protein HOP28_16960 [Gemmatimonadales bacterium]|nr:hypothetical protein [Gemmatimonadales bacterium]
MRAVVPAVLAALLSAPTVGRAQTLDTAQRAAAIDSAAALLSARYVFPQVGRQIADSLRSRLRRGEYDTLGSAVAVARRLSTELNVLSRDGHLRVIAPEAARTRGMLAQGAAEDPAVTRARRAEAARRQNHFFRTYQLMPGNVAFLAFDEFPLPQPAEPTAAAMMQLLSNADAVIIDLRANTGGVEGLNQFLASYFVPDTTRVLYTRYLREQDTTMVIRPLASVPGPRLPEVPLYLLVGGFTASAAENFAYSMQGIGRATVVGERTAGAANSSRAFSLPTGLVLNLPVARVVSPYTGTNWEGTGVQPNVSVPLIAARDSAYTLALRTLLAKATDSVRRLELEEALAATAAVRPFLPTRPLAEYVGTYGNWSIALRDGALVHDFGGGTRPLQLVPVGHDLFTSAELPDAAIRFARDRSGRLTDVHVWLPSRRWHHAARRQP